MYKIVFINYKYFLSNDFYIKNIYKQMDRKYSTQTHFHTVNYVGLDPRNRSTKGGLESFGTYVYKWFSRLKNNLIMADDKPRSRRP